MTGGPDTSTSILRVSELSAVERKATDEPFDLRGEFARSYARWILAKRTFDGSYTHAHIISQAWEEYIGWRDMWVKS